MFSFISVTALKSKPGTQMYVNIYEVKFLVLPSFSLSSPSAVESRCRG